MSNGNNTSRNVYNTSARTDEMAMLLNQSQAHGPVETTINIDNDVGPSTSQQHRHHQPLHLNTRRESGAATRINMEASGGSVSASDGSNSNLDERQRIRSLFSMFREARHQLHRQQSSRDRHIAVTTDVTSVTNGDAAVPGSHQRTWRENLYDVLGTPRTDVLRAIFTPSSTSGNVRYNSLPTNDNPNSEENFHFMLNQNSLDLDMQRNRPADNGGLETQSTSTSGLRISRQSSRLDNRSLPDNASSAPATPLSGVGDRVETPGSRRQSNGNGGVANNGQLPPAPPQRQTSTTDSTAPTVDMDDADTNAMGEMIVKFVAHFVRYIPFICILLVKFVHDHLLGILDLIVLTAVVFHINKMLKEQVAKLHQKSYAILIRDTIFIIFIVTYRFLLASTTPDPFGLLINPPGEKLSLDLSFSPAPSAQKTDGDGGGTLDPVRNYLNQIVSASKHANAVDEVPSDPTSNPLNNGTISLTKTISLGVLLYYVAVNDLILKLLTQLVKIAVTMMPTKFIRHKSRARLYALIEYISQFYRALAPMRQWLTFLFESYTGLEIISGILFSSFYLGAKGFEFVERGKSLKKALVNFVRNMDYDRKPTKDELDAAGTVCPICHDSYTTPVVLECGHIFCDECVNTWFKREQTCPMCRAKVSEDPMWQDGATTYFYQLF